MFLGIYDNELIVSVNDKIEPLYEFLNNGLKQLMGFMIKLPQIFYKFFNIIPEPLYSVIISFAVLLIVVIFFKAVK